VPDLPCIDAVSDGGGSAVATGKRKALRKCDLAIQKATATLVAGTSKAVQACAAAEFTCLQSKADKPDCPSKASGTCAKSFATLPKLTTRFTAAIAKICGAAPLEAGDVLGPAGLGAGGLADTCKAVGVPSLLTVGDLTDCLRRQASCRAKETLVNQTPRLAELLSAGGVTLP